MLYVIVIFLLFVNSYCMNKRQTDLGMLSMMKTDEMSRSILVMEYWIPMERMLRCCSFSSVCFSPDDKTEWRGKYNNPIPLAFKGISKRPTSIALVSSLHYHERCHRISASWLRQVIFRHWICPLSAVAEMQRFEIKKSISAFSNSAIAEVVQRYVLVSARLK